MTKIKCDSENDPRFSDQSSPNQQLLPNGAASCGVAENNQGGSSSVFTANRLNSPSPTEPLLLDPSSAFNPDQRKRARRTSRASIIGILGRDGFEDFEVVERERELNSLSSFNMGVKIEDSSTEKNSGESPLKRDDNDEEDARSEGLVASLRRYPKGVFFMLGNEFCERFSFYGMRAILTIYLISEHHFQESTASFCYHAFISLAYFSPLFGSIAADNYFGRFRVILWVSLIYVFGHFLLSLGAIPYFPYAVRSFMDFGGLAVIALATGGIKPCVSVFAADQFNEDMKVERAQFFSFFYFSINAGSLVAIMLTPILRGRVSCFGSEYCFPLAFGVPGVLMFVAFIVFIAGWRFYKITPAGKGNVIWKVCKCIAYAIRGKVLAKLRGRDTAAHWLDYAQPKYHDSLIVGVKSLIAVFVLFIPVVFFWALFDQQGSTWVLQARRMDGRVGPLTILPDQMNTVNPLMIILLVPIFEAFIYPGLRKVCNITPLRKMAVGGLLASLAFLLAGLVQLKVNETLEPLPSDGHVFIQRMGNSSAVFTSDTGLKLLSNEKNEWPAGNYTLHSKRTTFNVELAVEKCGYVIGVFDRYDGTGESLSIFPYACEKSENGVTRVYVLIEENSPFINTTLYVLDNNGRVKIKETITEGASVNIKPTFISSPNYVIAYGSCHQNNNSDALSAQDPEVKCHKNIELFAQMGAAHVLVLQDDRSTTNKNSAMSTVVRANSVNMLWQVPQFFIITLGEVMFSITGLEFSYSQAAPTMKSVLQALWLLTIFFGNVIDMGISGTHIIHEPAAEFFLYAFLMFVVICIFILISMNYTYVNEHYMAEESKKEEQLEELEETQHQAKLSSVAASLPDSTTEAYKRRTNNASIPNHNVNDVSA